MPTEKFTQLKKDRQDYITQAMMHRFAKQDYEEISIQDLADEAGISKGTFYSYFGDKKGAFLLVADQYKQNVIQELFHIYAKSTSLVDIILATYDYFTHLSSFERKLLQHINNNLSHEVQSIILEVFDQFNHIINLFVQENLKNDAQPDNEKNLTLLKEILSSILLTAIVTATFGNEQSNTAKESLRQKIDFVLNAFKKI